MKKLKKIRSKGNSSSLRLISQGCIFNIMKDFIKKGASAAADLGSSAVKGAVAALLAEITREILEETGATDIAKEKMMEVGTKIVKEMGMDTQKLQRDLIKSAIKKELNLGDK